MDLFTRMAHEWANFFGALAQVSGALVGLVFVALTFKPKALVGGGDPLMGALARQTFADFLLLLLISMAMLVPHLPAAIAGTWIFALAAADVLRTMHNFSRLHVHWTRMRVLQRFLLSIVGHVLLGVEGVELMRGVSDPGTTDTLLMAGVGVLLLSGCRSAWLLVAHENDPTSMAKERWQDPGLRRDNGRE